MSKCIPGIGLAKFAELTSMTIHSELESEDQLILSRRNGGTTK